MAEPPYVRASLLDRLIDSEPLEKEESRPLRVQTPEQMKVSLQRDLEWLLNTRCPVSLDKLDWDARSVLDYGIPDFGAAFTQNTEDWRRLSVFLEKTITAYEPRLRDVKVILRRARNPKEVMMGLEARLVMDGVNEPVSFPMLFQMDKEGGRRFTRAKVRRDDNPEFKNFWKY